MALRALIQKHPLAFILILGFLMRIIASIYSTGYLMHDDHFLVVETGASWAVGEDYNNWLPAGQLKQGIANPTPHQANLAYPGIVSGFFRVCNALNITHPQTQMWWLRFLHGIYSLFLVVFAFKIAQRLAGQTPAIWSALALAAFGLFPMLGVRQLIEMVCIVPLLWSAWIVLRHDPERRSWKTWALAGIGIGLATALRYQCGVFGLGWVIALFVAESNWKKAMGHAAVMGSTAIGVFFLGQIQDWIIWGTPFAQLRAYIEYNVTHSGDYPQGQWHQYIWAAIGLLIPPFSFAWLFGTIREWKRLAYLVIPAVAFFVFHSIFPNKQERFILPAIPFFIIAGSIGWHAFERQSNFWKQRRTLRKLLVGLGVGLSVCLGFTLCFIQPKHSRVQAMNVLFEQGDLENFLMVHTGSGGMPPQFYSGSWSKYWTSDLSTDVLNHRQVMCNSPKYTFPNYIVFSGDEHLGEGVAQYQEVYESMEYIGQAPPSKWDRFLSYLNPHNASERFMIYRISSESECNQ